MDSTEAQSYTEGSNVPLTKEQNLKLRQQHVYVLKLLSHLLNLFVAFLLLSYCCRPNLSVHYSSFFPLKIVRGEGVYFYDENGQAYIDCINNVAHGEDVLERGVNDLTITCRDHCLQWVIATLELWQPSRSSWPSRSTR